ncbi:MAG: sugar phosphate nucleotidyltransferase [Candidatus Aenigmatarchaeota archaeon]
MAIMDGEIVGLIPAAGSGSRMYPFARAVPKEMYPILGKAVIEHCIENLKEGGIKNIFAIVGHQKGALMDYIGDGSFYDVKVAYIYQLERKGLGHAILQGENWINNTFLVLLGDSFIEPKIEIRDLVDLHKKNNCTATLLVFEVDSPEGYGVVKFKDIETGEIEKMIEKPNEEEAKEYENNGKYYAILGAYLFEPKIFEYIKQTPPGAKNEIQITDAIALALKNNERVFGRVLRGKYIDIGKWETVLKAEKEINEKADIEKHIEERERFANRIKDK